MPLMEGVSLLPLFKGDSIEREQPLFYDWRDGRAIQTERWKLVRLEDEWELYDRQTDRTETTNLAGQHPDIVDQLQARWQQWAGGDRKIEPYFSPRSLRE